MQSKVGFRKLSAISLFTDTSQRSQKIYIFTIFKLKNKLWLIYITTIAINIVKHVLNKISKTFIPPRPFYKLNFVVC